MTLGEFIKNFSHNNIVRLHYKIKGGNQKKRFLIDIENQLIELDSEFFESKVINGKVYFIFELYYFLLG
jgi:hypothetical protein